MFSELNDPAIHDLRGGNSGKKRNNRIESLFPRIEPMDNMAISANIRPIQINSISKGVLDIGTKIIKNSGNGSIVISPLSIFIPLYTLLCGSSGQTESELKKFLSTTDSNNNSKFLNDISNTFGKNNILLNRIYINDKYQINKSFVDKMQPLHVAKNVHFESTLHNKLNDFISKSTNGLIKNIIPQLSDDDVMLILNIIYFKSLWKHEFDKTMTRKDYFNGETNKMVDFMNITEKFDYYEDNIFQTVELPYKTNLFTMGFILPTQKNFVMPTMEQIYSYIGNLSTHEVKVTIPKFEQTTRVGMNNVLQKMGLVSMFAENCQDFGKISNDGIHVSNVIHMAVIKVDEAGTEATAATTIAMCVNKCSKDTKKIYYFNANHPFLYYIRHVPSNMIIFLGKYC